MRMMHVVVALLLVAAPAAAQKVIADYPPNTNPDNGDLLLLQPAGSRTTPYNNLTLQQLWASGVKGSFCPAGTSAPLLNQANQPMLNQANQPMLTSGGGGGCLASSCSGLPSGAFWNDAGHVGICP